MLRKRLERRAETYGNAHTDQQPPCHHPGHAMSRAEGPYAGRSKEEHPRRYAARAVVIEQHACRNLGTREAEKVETGEKAKIGCGKSEFMSDQRREARLTPRNTYETKYPAENSTNTRNW